MQRNFRVSQSAFELIRREKKKSQERPKFFFELFYSYQLQVRFGAKINTTRDSTFCYLSLSGDWLNRFEFLLTHKC